MKVIGYDAAGRPESLPSSVDDYFGGAAKRFAHIRRMELRECGKIQTDGERLRGDFALLRAFLADHDRDILVQAQNDTRSIRLFFSAYRYDFVEDTFARAIHHKIEGSGYALRECVGKYELRIREYDRLFSRVAQEDEASAIRMAVARLRAPVNVAKVHHEAYTDYLRRHDEAALRLVAASRGDAADVVRLLTQEHLVSRDAARAVLPSLQEERFGECVSLLLSYLDGLRDGGARQRRLSL